MAGKANFHECEDCQHRTGIAGCSSTTTAASARKLINGTCYEAPKILHPPTGIHIPIDPRYPAEQRPLVTSEMKAACIGDFHVEVEHTCPYCFTEEPNADCEVCKGAVTYTVQHQVPWDTMKAIYRAMVAAAKGGTDGK